MTWWNRLRLMTLLLMVNDGDMTSCGVHVVADCSNGHRSIQQWAFSTFREKCRNAEIKPCSFEGPLGMENKVIPDTAITASSFYNNRIDHAPQRSRLNTKGLCAAWAAARGDNHPWIQVAFGDVVYITALITQGRNDASQWVTAYNVMYSGNVEPTKYVTDAYGIPTEFKGNTDRNSPVTTRFETTLVTRFLRILPTQKYGYFSMRFEVIGCVS